MKPLRHDLLKVNYLNASNEMLDLLLLFRLIGKRCLYDRDTSERTFFETSPFSTASSPSSSSNEQSSLNLYDRLIHHTTTAIINIYEL